MVIRRIHRRDVYMPVVVVIALTLLIGGCFHESEQPQLPNLLGFEPSPPSVTVNESIDIVIKFSDADKRIVNLFWTVEAGKFTGGQGIGDGQATISYQAPAVPGDYGLMVSVEYSDAEEPISHYAKLKVLPETTNPAD